MLNTRILARLTLTAIASALLVGALSAPATADPNGGPPVHGAAPSNWGWE